MASSRTTRTGVALAAAALTATAALAGGTYEITSFTIDCGGGEATGATFTLNGTIGQHDADEATGATYTALGGFWPGAGDAAGLPCPADCAPPGGGNGLINIDDLVAVVNAISTQDLDCDNAPDNGDGTFGNGVINFDDLIGVVNAFGPCP